MQPMNRRHISQNAVRLLMQTLVFPDFAPYKKPEKMRFATSVIRDDPLGHLPLAPLGHPPQ
jgi:hypothetical protein